MTPRLIDGLALPALVAAIVLASPGPAEAAWSRPTTVASSNRHYYYEPDLATNAEGSAASSGAAKNRWKNTNRASKRPPAAIAFGGHGAATAAWVNQIERPAPANVPGVVTTRLESVQYTP